MITLLRLRPYTGDVVAPSPNHDARRATAIEGIVLHATADEGDEAGTLSWLRSPKSRVSCHLLVSRSGRVTRLVGDQQRAWHAGVSWWRGTSDVNSITLGIEIANRNDGEPYTDEQYRRVAEIVGYYCRQGLSIDDVVSHEAIAEDRRTDPFGWDWKRLRVMVQDPLEVADVPAGRTTHGDQRLTAASAPSSLGGAIASPKPGQPISAPKPAVRSRTIWLNGLTVLAAAGALLGETLKLAFWVGLNIPEKVTMWALFAVGLVNILLRFGTSQPIGSNCVPDASTECVDQAAVRITDGRRLPSGAVLPAIRSSRPRVPIRG